MPEVKAPPYIYDGCPRDFTLNDPITTMRIGASEFETHLAAHQGYPSRRHLDGAREAYDIVPHRRETKSPTCSGRSRGRRTRRRAIWVALSLDIIHTVAMGTHKLSFSVALLIHQLMAAYSSCRRITTYSPCNDHQPVEQG